MKSLSFPEGLEFIPAIDFINPHIARVVGDKKFKFPEFDDPPVYELCPMPEFFATPSRHFEYADLGELLVFTMDDRFVDMRSKGEIISMDLQIFIDGELYWPSIAWFGYKRWLGLIRGRRDILCSRSVHLLYRR